MSPLQVQLKLLSVPVIRILFRLEKRTNVIHRFQEQSGKVGQYNESQDLVDVFAKRAYLIIFAFLERFHSSS